jgi:hypothetical protein
LSDRLRLAATTTITGYALAILVVNESHPAASDVGAGAAEVVEDGLVLAAGLLKGVGKHSEACGFKFT